MMSYKTKKYFQDGTTALHWSAAENRPKVAEILLQKERGLKDVLNDQMNLPIQIAVKFGNLEVLKVLIMFDSNLVCQDDEGNTLLHFAAMSRNAK